VKPIDPFAVVTDLLRSLAAVVRPQLGGSGMARVRSVLILDDDADLCQEIGELVGAAGHRVMTTGDSSILDDAIFHDFDVLLLDLGLPAIDGVDVLRQLARRVRAPAVIVMTGHGESILRAVTIAAASEGLKLIGGLTKPIDPDTLLAAIERDDDLERRPERASAAIGAAYLRDVLNAGRLPVWFQPKIAAGTLEFAGAEALLGGVFPGLGAVSAEKVISVARESPEVLVQLTREVLRQGALACVEWTRAGWKGPINVNAPIEALVSPDAVLAMVDIVREAGVAPEQVNLELVEDSLYDHSAEALGVLAKLRLAGFGLALDDVGKRNSGLLQLANLPVTEIKIDLEIIRQARSWAKARNIFGSLAELGGRLGCEVIAEGVELQSDFDFVRKHPVDFVQGHLILKKAPLPDLLAALPTLAGSLAVSDSKPVGPAMGLGAAP
jgi:EAL domain-containing protein (putative c-di-GMP-specific phosphodiesterase class I)/ActR/RegA family two-component response regulator